MEVNDDDIHDNLDVHYDVDVHDVNDGSVQDV